MQARGDFLLRLIQNAHQVASRTRILGGEEGISSAVAASTGRTADAVNVILSVVGEIIVDYKSDVLDVYSSQDVNRQSDWHMHARTVVCSERTPRGQSRDCNDMWRPAAPCNSRTHAAGPASNEARAKQAAREHRRVRSDTVATQQRSKAQMERYS